MYANSAKSAAIIFSTSFILVGALAYISGADLVSSMIIGVSISPFIALIYFLMRNACIQIQDITAITPCDKDIKIDLS